MDDAKKIAGIKGIRELREGEEITISITEEERVFTTVTDPPQWWRAVLTIFIILRGLTQEMETYIQVGEYKFGYSDVRDSGRRMRGSRI